MTDLKDALVDIDGVGEKTAEKIMGVVSNYADKDTELLAKAREAAQEGDDRTAAIFLRRATGDD